MTRVLVIVGFLVSLAAGLTVGLSVSDRVHEPPPPRPEDRHPGPSPGPGPQPQESRDRRGPGSPGSWLAQQLDLSTDQQQQLDAIWSEVARDRGREQWDMRSKLRKERDDAIAALIPEDRKAEYERIHSDYDARVEDMESQWRSRFQQAVEKTKAILTPDQREKYDAILARHDRDRGSSPGGPGSRDRKSRRRDRDEGEPDEPSNP